MFAELYEALAPKLARPLTLLAVVLAVLAIAAVVAII
jgi:hypothetical protein